MDDLMKAILAKAEAEVDKQPKKKHQVDSKKAEENKHHIDAKKPTPKETVHVVQPESKSEPKESNKAEPNWSAETEKTSILPALLEPQTPKPKPEPKKVEHQDDANLEKEQEEVTQPAPTIKIAQAKVEPGIKLYVAMGSSFFGVALLAAIYTALRVTGVM